MKVEVNTNLAKEFIEKWFTEIDTQSREMNEDDFLEGVSHLRGGIGMAYICKLITPDEYSEYYDRITWITSSHNGHAYCVIGANVPDEP